MVHNRALGPHTCVVVVVSLLLAGCMGPGNSGPGDAEADALSLASRDVTFLMSALDAPDNGEDVAVTMTIGHIGLYDPQADEWYSLLSAPVTVDLFFNAIDPTVVTQVPVPVARYTDVEMIIDSAQVFTAANDPETAFIDASVCFAPITFDLAGDTTATEFELIFSGSEGVRGGPGGWSVRPALAGGFSYANSEDSEVSEPSCSG